MQYVASSPFSAYSQTLVILIMIFLNSKKNLQKNHLMVFGLFARFRLVKYNSSDKRRIFEAHFVNARGFYVRRWKTSSDVGRGCTVQALL